MLAFGARMSPGLSALRDSRAQICPLDRVEKWGFMSKSLFQGASSKLQNTEAFSHI